MRKWKQDTDRMTLDRVTQLSCIARWRGAEYLIEYTGSMYSVHQRSKHKKAQYIGSFCLYPRPGGMVITVPDPAMRDAIIPIGVAYFRAIDLSADDVAQAFRAAIPDGISARDVHMDER